MNVSGRISRDEVVYALWGVFLVGVFVAAVAAMAAAGRIELGGREMRGLVVGFALFVGSYFAAILTYRLLTE